MNRLLLCIVVSLMLSVSTAWAQTDRQHIREGNRKYRNGQYAEAAADYKKATEKNPQNARAIYNHGCAMMQLGSDSTALKLFSDAAVQGNEAALSSKAYYNMGCIHQRAKDYSNAIEDYKNALRKDPGNEDARYNLSLCQRQQKKQEQQKQQDGGQNNNKQNQDDKQKDDSKKNQQKDQSPPKKDNDKKEQQQDRQMSKENAEQLINAAVQQEKATQQRLQKAMQQPRRRNLDRNW